MRIPVIAIASLVINGCAIPAADNPYDPRHAPDVTLSVSVRPNGGNPDGSDDLALSEGGRYTQFVLRATSSRPATFRFQAGDGDDYEISPTANTSTAAEVVLPVGALTLTAEMLPSGGVGSAVVDVRTRARASKGVGEASASIVLRNSAPVAVIPDVFVSAATLPYVVIDGCGGLPDPADCTSVDSEDDPTAFTWTWTPLGDAPAVTPQDARGRRVGFQPDSPTRSYAYRVQVSDGLASSTPVIVQVHPGSQLWVATDLPQNLYRIFPEFTVRTSIATTAGSVTFSDFTDVAVAPDGAIWTAEFGSVQRLDAAFRRSMSVDVRAAVDPDASVHRLAATENGTCAGLLNPIAETTQWVWIEPDGTLLAGPVHPYSLPGGPQLQASPAGSSSCWVLDDALRKFDATGTETVAVPLTLGGSYATEMAVLPDGTVWVTEADPFSFSTQAFVYDGTLATLSLPTFVESIVPHPGLAGSVLLYTGGSDPGWAVTDAGGQLTPDETLPSPDVAGIPPHVLADTAGGALWFDDLATVTLHRFAWVGGWVETGSVAIEDLADLFDANPYWDLLRLDPGTGMAVAAIGAFPDPGALARIPSHLRRIERVENPTGVVNGIQLSISPNNGDVYVVDPSESSGGVKRVSSQGRILFENDDWRGAVATTDGGAWVFDETAQALVPTARSGMPTPGRRSTFPAACRLLRMPAMTSASFR